MENKKDKAVNDTNTQPILETIVQSQTHHMPGISININMEIGLDELIIGQPMTYVKECIINEMNKCTTKVLHHVDELKSMT